jgi:hypothetical protein
LGDAAPGDLEVDHLLALARKVEHADASANVPIAGKRSAQKTIRTRRGSGGH